MASAMGEPPASPFLSMGLNTYRISLKDLHGTNRTKLVKKLRESGVPRRSVVYLKGGVSENRNDTDHEPLFRQESYFLYLWGVKEPDCEAILETDTGRTTLFVPRLPQEYATFMGKIKTPEEWQELYQVDEVLYVDEAEDHLEKLLSNSSNVAENGNGSSETTNGGGHGPPKLLVMEGRNSDSGNLYQAPTLKSSKLTAFTDSVTLFPILAECRVHKSAAELNLMQHVTELTSLGHVYTMRNTSPSMMEYQCESLFRHYCYYSHGSRLVGYTPICGCGPNGAILHYGHAGEPNARQIQDGDVCLFDLGAEYFGYGSDVTCSFPANGRFTDKQASVYTAVLNAQRAVYRRLKPGVSWVDCHKAAEAAILQVLIDLGIVVTGTKSVDELVEMRLGAVFMPHGLGHFVGIDTHDVGGYLPGHPARSELPGLRSLRTARTLDADMVLTVEPGCYFIDHLLDQALESPKLNQYLRKEVLAGFRNFGGVRLEDVVAITESAFVNYTTCPRTVSEVEHVIAGGKWPPLQDEAPELGRVRLTDPTPRAHAPEPRPCV